MSIERVKAYFAALGREQDVRELSVSSATVALAAQALGVEEARIAKTLSFYHEEGALLIVAAGDAKIDNTKFKALFAHKAKMLNAEDVQRLTGHAIGGVCPFALAQPEPPVFLDISLQRFATVFPACGSSNSAIELTCDELQRYTQGQWIDVCKGWQPQP